MNETLIDLEKLEETLVDIPEPIALPPARPLDAFVLDPATNGGNLLGNRFLCRGGGLLFVGPTGIGKSVVVMQKVILFALGRDAFGLKPARPLRTLMIQAENDDGDIAEMRDGIFAGLGLGEEERKTACENVKIVCESSTTGKDFVELVGHLVREHKPDLLVIDPLLAYLGDSVLEQSAVSAFLRNGLNPILQANGSALILVHHTNKPPSGKEKADWKAGDFAYLGAGTSELANWARAVVGMKSTGDHDVFQFVLGKRGKRAGIVNADGKPQFELFLRHAAQGICWEAVPENELPSMGRRGAATMEDVFALIPTDTAISSAALRNKASEQGIGQNRCRDLLKQLIEEKRVFPWGTPRAGTNPEKSYSRIPQPQTEQHK